MHTKPPLAIALLAAGASRRLGHPKQLLTQAGQPLVRRMAELALQLPASRRIVITGARAEAITAALRPLELEMSYNSAWAEGIASSIRQVVNCLGAHPGPCLFLTVDQPRLELAHLQRLVHAQQQWPEHNIASGYAGVAGIPAILCRRSWRQGQQLHADIGLRHLLRSPSTSTQIMAAEALAIDIDTPAQLAAAIQQGWIDPLPTAVVE